MSDKGGKHGKTVKNVFSSKNNIDLIEQLIKLAVRISRPSNQLQYDMDKCLVETSLIFELRMLLKEIKNKKSVNSNNLGE